MTIMLNVSTNDEVMREFGLRLRGYRLRQNRIQGEIARLAGVTPATVVNAEAGKNVRLESIVRILRALGQLEALNDFLPEPTVSPIQLLALHGKVRQRARKRSQ